MPQLVNLQNNTLEDVPDQDIDKSILAGTHTFQAGEQIPLKAPDGNYATIPAENIHYALGQGYKVYTPAQAAIDDAVRDNHNATGALKVFGSQMLDQVGLGLPELIYEKTGDPMAVAKYQAIKKDHEAANILGNVTGFGASLISGAPVFKAATAAGKIVEQQLIKRMGAQLGEEVGSRTLAQTAQNIVANLAGKTAGGAIEGATLFMPHAVTEAALGDPDQAAETIASGLGVGALFGAGGYAAKGLLKLGKTGLEKASELVGEAPLTAQKVARTAAETATGVKGEDLEAYIANPERINNAMEMPQIKENLDSHISQMQQQLDEAKSAASLSKREQDEAYKFGLQDLRKQTAPEALRNEIMTDLDATKASIGDLSQKVDTVLEGSNKEFDLNLLKKQIEKNAEKLKIAGEVPVGKASQAAYAELSSLKATLDSLPQMIPAVQMRKLVQQISENTSFDYAAGEYNSKLDAIYKNIRKSLNTTLKDAVPEIEPLLNQMSHTLDTTGPMVKYFGNPATADSTLERLIGPKAKMEKQLLQEFGAITGKDYFQGLSGLQHARDLLQESAVKNIPDKVVPGHFDRAAEAQKAYEAVKERNEELVKRFSPNRTQSIITRQGYKNASIEDKKAFEKLKELTGSDFSEMIKDRHVLDSFGKTSTNGSRKAIVFGALGNAIGGPVGAAIGAAAGAGLDIYSGKLLKKLVDRAPNVSGLLFVEAQMKKAAEKLDLIPGILDNLSRKTPATVRNIGIDITGQILQRREDHHGKRQAKHESIEEMRTAMSDIGANPARFQQILSQYSAPISEYGAPNIGDSLNGKMSQAFNYIFDQLPKAKVPTSPFAPQKAHKPSDQEVSQFSQKLEIVEDPWAVLEHLKDGTITTNHMEALSIVYPKIKSAIQSRVQKHIMDGKVKPISYQKRIKLSLLMDAPMDRSIGMDAIQLYQHMYQVPDQTVDKSLGKTVNLAKQNATDIERLQMPT